MGDAVVAQGEKTRTKTRLLGACGPSFLSTAALPGAETRTTTRLLSLGGPSFLGAAALLGAETRTTTRLLSLGGPSFPGATALRSLQTRTTSRNSSPVVLVPVSYNSQLDLFPFFRRFSLTIPTTIGLFPVGS